MNTQRYQKYLRNYITEARQNTDGSIGQMRDFLSEIRLHRWLVRDREEKERALADVRKAFDEHRHWPLSILLSHLGIEEPPQ